MYIWCTLKIAIVVSWVYVATTYCNYTNCKLYCLRESWHSPTKNGLQNAAYFLGVISNPSLETAWFIFESPVIIWYLLEDYSCMGTKLFLILSVFKVMRYFKSLIVAMWFIITCHPYCLFYFSNVEQLKFTMFCYIIHLSNIFSK